ncbi:MAG: hypothetical protein AVDCRST_MAG37-1521 [uncultured Rubrobacteraceae bacterium]|uniref:Uncharacterized protein n=1 Tax=uncultured Rubrobacteraceae bacterium TaxID=349277 RepID=A0A6J4QKQ8_9ACTN|nr:MAG: hypothetical protein AVDCRST_MAG37-1521 [uncultured Rubrobacteraceae bacterium]
MVGGKDAYDDIFNRTGFSNRIIYYCKEYFCSSMIPFCSFG